MTGLNFPGPDSMIYAAGLALSKALLDSEREQRWLYPDISRIREVSVVVAREVIKAAEAAGVARDNHINSLNDQQLDDFIRSKQYDPYLETDKVEKNLRSLLRE